jgi:cytochrome c-type biogenesis protein CcmH
MIWFWLIAAAASAVTGLLLTSRAAAAARAAATPVEPPAVAVHRRQLAELDELATRGLIAGDDLAAARAEAARRLLNAAETAPPVERPGSPAVRRVLAAVSVAVGLAALGLYLLVGRAGLPDQPYQARLTGWLAEAKSPQGRLTLPEAVAVLRSMVARRPEDPTGWYRLGQLQMQAGEAGEASRAFARAARLSPKTPDFEIAYGMAVMAYSEGKVTADALAAFRRALALDPASGPARYFIGRSRIADGDVKGGLDDWRALAGSLPAGDPNHASLLTEIAQVEQAGGLPPPAADTVAPPQAQAAAPGAGGQQAFIHAMVDRLAKRLQASPDDPDGWARLVRSYGVLKDAAAQDKALARARQLFARRPDALAAIEAAARSAPAR